VGGDTASYSDVALERLRGDLERGGEFFHLRMPQTKKKGRGKKFSKVKKKKKSAKRGEEGAGRLLSPNSICCSAKEVKGSCSRGVETCSRGETLPKRSCFQPLKRLLLPERQKGRGGGGIARKKKRRFLSFDLFEKMC